MSREFIVPYTKRIVATNNKSTRRIIYSPYLETFLSHENQHLGFLFPSIVDSGADRCIFPLAFAEHIGLDITKSPKHISKGLGGGDVIYFHKVTVRIVIQKQSWQFDCEAGFAASLNDMGVGFLGRRGFFELFDEVAFCERKRELRLKLANGE